MPFYVYILYSKSKDKYYTGQTQNLSERLTFHESGMSPYTSSAQDWMLVYSEEFSTRSEAIKRENEIKRKKSRKYIEWMISLRKGISSCGQGASSRMLSG
ncbi:MAG TPA: GIY-YIG nuclease family protein [Bacteroidia bacterium]|nr:GIY-YIG nuclease family protein [Bacteroidia bacterium]